MPLLIIPRWKVDNPGNDRIDFIPRKFFRAFVIPVIPLIRLKILDLLEQIPVLLTGQRWGPQSSIAHCIFFVALRAMALIEHFRSFDILSSCRFPPWVWVEGLDVSTDKRNGPLIQNNGVRLHELAGSIRAVKPALVASKLAQLIRNIPPWQPSDRRGIHRLNTQTGLEMTGHTLVSKNLESRIRFSLEVVS